MITLYNNILYSFCTRQIQHHLNIKMDWLSNQSKQTYNSASTSQEHFFCWTVNQTKIKLLKHFSSALRVFVSIKLLLMPVSIIICFVIVAMLLDNTEVRRILLNNFLLRKTLKREKKKSSAVYTENGPFLSKTKLYAETAFSFKVFFSIACMLNT